MTKYLTKSRFKSAAECPRKLYYTGKPHYVNTKAEDEFLQALADGGYQVGELAKIQIGGGIEIISRGHDQQLADTANLMLHESVIIYEAAFRFEHFFIRVDILKKDGNNIDLIEVKAASFNSLQNGLSDTTFLAANGEIAKGWLPYLRDIAFQSWVMKALYPSSSINSFLMMPDKSKRCTVDNLNQRFQATRQGNQVSIAVKPDTNLHTIGEPILSLANVNPYVQMIHNTPLTAPGVQGSFADIARSWAEHYSKDLSPDFIIGAHCSGCEFKSDEISADIRSGFHECWKQKLGWNDEDFAGGTVLDLFSFAGKQKLMDRGIFKLKDITEEMLSLKPDPQGLTSGQRQWMQVSSRWPGGGDFYINRQAMHDAMDQWEYPLHFIDFETSTPGVPFFKGDKPYDMIAFQFSHHEMDAMGVVRHAGEFLGVEPGVMPCFDFVRALKNSVDERGTVFMWSPHENTTLNSVAERLKWAIENAQAPADAGSLLEFIDSLVTRKDEGQSKHVGKRVMYDLCNLAKRHFFHPMTQGSSSIKQVLPAVLESSVFLQRHYSHATYQSGNFSNKRWLERDESGKILSPYKLLTPMYNDIEPEVLESHENSDSENGINHGGAAATAYVRLQSETMSAETREFIHKALLRYCELDTLAMVMIVQAWMHWVRTK